MSNSLWIPAIYNPLLGPCFLPPTLASPLFLVTPLLLLVIQRSLCTSPSETVLSAGGAPFPKSAITKTDRPFESKLKDTSPPYRSAMTRI